MSYMEQEMQDFMESAEHRRNHCYEVLYKSGIETENVGPIELKRYIPIINRVDELEARAEKAEAKLTEIRKVLGS